MNIHPANGTISTDGDRASIQFERRFPHSIDKVWSGLTDPAQLAQWFGHAVIDGRQGGEILVEAGPQHIPVEVRRTKGRILVWDPPHVLEYEWRQAIIEESTLRFELVADGNATILKLTHRWLSLRNAQGFAPGWHAYLDRFAACLNGAEIADWTALFGKYQPHYGWKA